MSEQTRKKNILELTLPRAERHTVPIIMVLDDVRSLSNVGSILRTCDGLGIRACVMCGITGTPPSPEITKTALGAEQSVEWSHEPDCLAYLKRMQAQGWQICVLEQAWNSRPLQDFRTLPGQKYILVSGNEIKGVSQQIVDLADHVLEIPQHGAKHCLNVAVSTGIALWTLSTPLHTHPNP